MISVLYVRCCTPSSANQHIQITNMKKCSSCTAIHYRWSSASHMQHLYSSGHMPSPPTLAYRPGVSGLYSQPTVSRVTGGRVRMIGSIAGNRCSHVYWGTPPVVDTPCSSTPAHVTPTPPSSALLVFVYVTMYDR